jgi:gliding motility-associated-like protein
LPLSTTISSSSTTICSGTGVSFFSTETNSGTSPTYQWQLNGSDILGATYATYSTNTLNDYDVISLVMTANEVCTTNSPAYSNSITMTVNPNPVLSLSTSSFSICEGSASTLSASGANSFTWTPSLLVGSIITVTPTINTTYVVEGENGSGCFATDSISIVVNALPVAIASLPSSDTICYNGAVGLALNSQADVTYNWSSSYGASINAQNPTFTNVTNIGNVYYYGSVTDINGCVSLYDTVLVVVTPSITLSALTTNVSCFGSTNGSINLSVLGGFAPYSYSWSNSVLTEDLSLLATGNYSVTVIDATACSNTLSVLVNEPSQLIANALVTTSIACNGGDAIVAVSATGGTGSYTGTGTYTVAAGNYTYTVTDANGCASNFTINIAEPQPLIINASATSSNICDGQSVNLTATGALTYTWNNSVSNGVSFTPTATANYIVIGTDINGCIGSETISITVNTLPIVIANTSSTIICIGQPLTLTGGGTATTYSWTNGVSDGIAFTPTINNSYIVTGTAVNGCSNSDTIDITLNQLPSLSIITSSSSICAGETSILTATGANTYLWNNGVSTSSLVVSPSTTTVYTLTGTSVFGCSNTQTVIINVNTLPIIFASSPGTAQPIPSYISTSGLIAWYPFNGNSNDESGNALNGIVSGATLTSDRFGVSNQSYSFNGLTDNISVPHNSILNSYPLTISCWIKTDASFSGGNILKKYLNSSWNGWSLALDSVSNDLAMIIPHYLRSSSPCNGIVEGYGICGNPVGLNHKGSVNDLNWHSIVFKVDNIGGTLYLDGQPVGQQNWIGLPGGVTSTIQMLIGQNFKGKIDDIGLWNRALTNQEITDLYTATSPSICSGVTTTLTSSGANSYTWNPGSFVGSSVLVNPTTNTTFTITGINSAGCSNTKTLSLIVNPLPQIIASASSNSVCAGNTISLTGSGSITNYTWTNGVNNGVAFTPTISSTYIVTGIGVNGCSNSDTLDVTINSLPSLSLTAFPSSICAGSSATLSALGATTYSWSTGSSLSTIFEGPIANTIYTVIGTDIVGCVNTETLSLTVNALPSLTISPSSNSVCVGNSATLTAVGANTYSWSTGATTSSEVVSPTATTIYTVVGIDAIGCSNWDTLRVFANSLPNIITNVNTNTVCLGGVVVFSNLGATTFTLNPSAFTGSLISVPMNTVGVTNYTVTGTGPLGCSNTVTVSLTTLDIPTVLISPSSNTICSGQSVILNASGANTYTWSNSGTVSFSITDVPSFSTSYSVIGLDINGCSNSASTTVNVSNTPSVSISSPSTNVCSGYTMGISASGASSYIWSTGAISNSINVQPFINTTYSVVGSNGSTCTDTAFWTLTVLPLPSVIANASSTLICDGQSVTLTGGGSASTYTWTNGVNDGIAFTPTVNNTYQVTGIDLNGCNSNSTIIVDVYYGTTAIPSVNPRVICIGDTSFLSVIGGSIPTWSLNSNPNILSVAPMSDVSYTYSAVDNNGCVGDIIFNISIDEACAIAVYNGLTPNGDGINDFWIIDNIENYSNNKVYIYNRWGNKVFQTSNYNNAENVWDGKFNGQVVPSGTYFYVIESNELIKKGWIEITN